MIFKSCVLHRIIRSLLSCDKHRILLGASKFVFYTEYYKELQTLWCSQDITSRFIIFYICRILLGVSLVVLFTGHY